MSCLRQQLIPDHWFNEVLIAAVRHISILFWTNSWFNVFELLSWFWPQGMLWIRRQTIFTCARFVGTSDLTPFQTPARQIQKIRFLTFLCSSSFAFDSAHEKFDVWTSRTDYFQHRPRSVNNATLSIFTSSKRRKLAERWELFLNVDFSSDTTIVSAELEHLGGHKTSLKYQIR